jgi:hypothetical protein
MENLELAKRVVANDKRQIAGQFSKGFANEFEGGFTKVRPQNGSRRCYERANENSSHGAR